MSKKEKTHFSNKDVKKASRELISPSGDKRYIRRDGMGRITESDDIRKAFKTASLRLKKQA